ETCAAALAIPPGILVRGIVVDERDAPVADVAVHLFPHLVESWWATPATRTASDGSFRLRDVPNSAFLRAGAPGRESTLAVPLGAVAGSETPIRLALSGRGVAIEGTVVDPAGQPVPHAVIVAGVESPKGVPGFEPRSTRSDPGVFDEAMR